MVERYPEVLLLRSGHSRGMRQVYLKIALEELRIEEKNENITHLSLSYYEYQKRRRL